MRQDDDLKKVVLVGTGFVGMSMAYSTFKYWWYWWTYINRCGSRKSNWRGNGY